MVKAPKIKKGWAAFVPVAVMTIGLPFTAHHEGTELKAYLDPVGVWTICNGETLNVQPGMTKTEEECKEMLETRLGWFAYRVDLAIDQPMKPETHAALASFAYNVGMGNFERSTLRKLYNNGDYIAACNELPKWKYAGGKVFNGLIKRRAEERKLCITGVNKLNQGDT